MTGFDTLRLTTTVQQSKINSDSPVTSALQARGKVLLMTQQAEEAVLKPVDPGSWPHALRAALAARIAMHNALPKLASHYAQMVDDDKFQGIADPLNDGSSANLRHIVTFMDAVAVQPRDVDDSAIQLLKDASVSDADIVRLTELNAFMAYQIRLIAGLTLLAENCEPGIRA